MRTAQLVRPHCRAARVRLSHGERGSLPCSDDRSSRRAIGKCEPLSLWERRTATAAGEGRVTSRSYVSLPKGTPHCRPARVRLSHGERILSMQRVRIRRGAAISACVFPTGREDGRRCQGMAWLLSSFRPIRRWPRDNARSSVQPLRGHSPR
jgi:hypothetical protein